MQKGVKIIGVVVCLFLLSAFFSCTPNSHGNSQLTLYYSGENDKIADFSTGLSPLFWASNGYSNGGVFDCVWLNSNVQFVEVDESLHLSIRPHSKYAASGAEYRTGKTYGFGYYSVKMKAIKKEGVVSSFFTYTGPSNHTVWDEIDIEFLGKDTTKVQFNYYSNGNGGHEFLYDLGFDASSDFHEYGFLWSATSITWFVDGVSVHCDTTNIPQTPAQIMINAWVGKSYGENSVANWLGKFDGEFPVDDAQYLWIGFRAN